MILDQNLSAEYSNPTANRRWGFFFPLLLLLLNLAACASAPTVRPSLDQAGLRVSAAEDTLGPVSSDPRVLLDAAHRHRWLGDYLRTVEFLDAADAVLATEEPASATWSRAAMLRRLALEKAWLHYDRAEWREGLRVARLALQQEPGDKSLRLIYGLLAAHDGRRSDAFEVADDFSRAEDHNPDGPWIRAAYRVSTGQLREAYNLVFPLNPNREHQAECWREMGEIAEVLREYSQADRWYTESAHAPPFGHARGVRSREYPRLKPGSRKTHQKVWLAFDRYYVTGSLSAYTRLAWDRFETAEPGPGKAFWAEQVVNAAGILLRKGIDEPWAYRVRGLVFEFGGETDRAIRDLKTASRRLQRLARPDGRIEATLGHMYLGKKDHVQALSHLEAAVDMDPASAGAWRDLGLALIMDEQKEAAEQALNRSLELDPESATSWYNRGLLYLHAKDYDRALSDLQEAARLAPRNGEVIDLLQRTRALQRRQDGS